MTAELRRSLTTCVFGVALGAFGCGQLLGVDEYRVSQGCGSDAFLKSDGTCHAVPACASDGDQVLKSDGTCAPAGVQGCVDGFEPDTAHPGGCRPIFSCADAGGSLAPLTSISCRLDFYCFPVLSSAVGLFVKAGAPTGGTGTFDHPFSTIQSGIDAAAAMAPTGKPVTINVVQGTYAEGPLRIDHPIVLTSGCPSRTLDPTSVPTVITLAPGAAPTDPVIDILPGADGSGVNGMTIHAEGAAVGIRVNGAANVALGTFLVVEGSDGPGLSFEDTSGPTSGTASSVAVSGALGVGIAVHGGTTFALDDVRVVNTRPSTADGRGVGIWITSSVSTAAALLPTGTFWDERTTRRPSVKITKTRIAAAFGAGIAVEGADVTVDGSSIQDVQADATGRSAGVLAERRWLGTRPTTFALTRSSIANVAGSGVHLDDVDGASIEDTTITDVTSTLPAPSTSSTDAGAAMIGGCQGNGIRVRSRLGATGGDGGAPIAITVNRVLIDGARESGVHVEGANVTVESTLVRHVLGCDGHFGDGIAAYDYPFSRASLTVKGSRVSNVLRSALVTFGAESTVQGSVFEAPSAVVRPSATNEAVFKGLSANLCHGKDTWSPCTSQDGTPESALFGYPSCDPSVAACVTACTTDSSSAAAGGETAVPGRSLWARDLDSIASAVGDQSGRFLLALPVGPDARGVNAGGFGGIPEIGLFHAARSGTWQNGDYEVVGPGGIGVQQTLLIREPPDARNAPFLTFQVCQPPSGPLGAPGEYCFGHGVSGVQAELLSVKGDPLDAVWAKPCYEGAGAPGCSAASNIQAVTSNGIGYFYNAAPGDYLFRLIAPSGTSLSCTTDGGNGVSLGWPVAGEPNTYRVHVEAAFLDVAVRAFCVLK